MRQGSMNSMPDDSAGYPYSEETHRRAFEERRLRPIPRRHANHHEADTVICHITQEIESVRLQRNRTGHEPRDNFNQEHGPVDSERSPHHAAVTPVHHFTAFGSTAI